jgi:hypothetical protein
MLMMFWWGLIAGQVTLHSVRWIWMIYPCSRVVVQESLASMARTEIMGFLSPAFRDLKVLLGLTAGPVHRDQPASAWTERMGLMASLSQEFPVRKVPQAPKVLKAPLGMGLTGKMAKMACLFRGLRGFREAKDCRETTAFLGRLVFQDLMGPMAKMECRSPETRVCRGLQELMELLAPPESLASMGRMGRTGFHSPDPQARKECRG